MIAHTRNLFADTDRRLRRWVKLFLFIGILELPFLLWLWISPLTQPRQFTNHQDQIAAALRQHGISVSQVYLDQGWPDRINHQTYGANLSLHVSDAPGSQPVIGRIECRVKKRNCWFQVAKLGIPREDLTDLVPVTLPEKPQPSWHDRMRDILARLGIQL